MLFQPTKMSQIHLSSEILGLEKRSEVHVGPQKPYPHGLVRFLLIFFVRMYVVMCVKSPLTRGPFSYLYTSVHRPYLYTTVGRFHLGPRFVRFSVVTLCFFLSTFKRAHKNEPNPSFIKNSYFGHYLYTSVRPISFVICFVRMYVLMCVKRHLNRGAFSYLYTSVNRCYVFAYVLMYVRAYAHRYIHTYIDT